MTTETTPNNASDAVPAIEQLLAAAPTANAPAQNTPAGGGPDGYEAFTLPAGVTIDGPSLAAATQLFRKAGLDQATAQQFVDLALGRERTHQQRNMQAFADLQNKWTGDVKADPEIGGDRLPACLAAAARVIDRLGVPGLREALSFTGAGNHPAVVKAFARLGQMLAEDRFQPGGRAAPAVPRSPADVIYDGLPRQ